MATRLNAGLDQDDLQCQHLKFFQPVRCDETVLMENRKEEDTVRADHRPHRKYELCLLYTVEFVKHRPPKGGGHTLPKSEVIF